MTRRRVSVAYHAASGKFVGVVESWSTRPAPMLAALCGHWQAEDRKFSARRPQTAYRKAKARLDRLDHWEADRLIGEHFQNGNGVFHEEATPPEGERL